MNNSVCYIFGAGDLYDEQISVDDNSFIIAADGGSYHTKRLNICPDILLGDFDSSDKPQSGDNCIVYPKEKDLTDTHIALQYAFNLGFKRFKLYGCLGGTRIEHTFANIQSAMHFSKLGCDITIYADKQELFFTSTIQGRKTIFYDKNRCGYISLFALGQEVKALTIRGLKYELTTYTLAPDNPLCISNEFINSESEISFDSGTLLIVTQSSL